MNYQQAVQAVQDWKETNPEKFQAWEWFGMGIKKAEFWQCNHTDIECVMPFQKALEILNKWYDEGHIITFFTSRTEEVREITEVWLDKHGFKYHGLLMGKPRGGNYHWIDNHIVKGTRYNGIWSDLIEKEVKIEVFED